MTTFYDKLKPKYKKILKKEAKQYDLINRSLIPELQSHLFYNDLPLRLIKELYTWCSIESYKLSTWDLLYGEFLIKKDKEKP